MNLQPNANLLRKLTGMFLVEAREHLQTLGSGLLELDPATTRDAQLPIIERLFRAAHSLKGAARTVNAGEIERFCKKLEGMFSELKSGKRALAAESLEGLHRETGALGRLVDALEASQRSAEPSPSSGSVPPSPPALTASSPQPFAPASPAPAMADRQSQIANPPVANASIANPPSAISDPQPAVANRQSAIGNRQSAIPAPPVTTRTDDTVRIATAKLDSIFVQVEEMLGVKLAQAERAVEVKALAGLAAERDRVWTEAQPWLRTLREQVEARTIAGGGNGGIASGTQELLVRLFALLDEERERAEAVSTHVADLAQSMNRDRRRFDALADRLLDDVKKALMLPFATIFAGFPKMVHDLASEAGKKIEFTMHGTEIEIDKRILEQIKDPLVHLVRNAMDHGIEPLAERTRLRKPATGKLTLAISQAAGKVEIQISDDGAGIDVAAVKAAAIHAGVISAEAAAALWDQDARQLVFRSGVTTNRQVTNISGRGLGMTIVHENVTRLGGAVSIESQPGHGTTFRLTLPLTLATLRGTLVRAANREFVIPTVNVLRGVRLPRTSVRRVENRDSISLDGVTLALVRLAEVLGLGQPVRADAGPLTILVLGHGPASVAFTVDQVVGEQEVLAKPLGPLLPRVRNLAGATVSGTGRVIPILSVPDLLQTVAGCDQTSVPVGAEAETSRSHRLLVVDDSITARTALQSILESAGFDVKTAPDGAAAFNLLQTDTFDLVVSDVEMPRMNGFELTRHIRSEPNLAQLPIVLVTARETQEDREQGLDAGANAYIGKSGFDQSNLLETLQRLL